MIEKKRSADSPQVSIVLPCLNEEQAIASCLEQIVSIVNRNNLKAEIIVVDNGSTDSSCKIALGKKVRLIHEKLAGYGAACLKGFEAAQGNLLFLADCDGSYDFGEIPRFIEELENGYDFVIGDRFKGKMEKGAMPWIHRYIGNPILSGIFRLFFNASIHDAHCGMRALTKEALKKLKLKTSGMEFASEMLIKAVKSKMKIKELNINYYKRRGQSKLKSFVDGWRHLRFMLLYSPLFLFFVPGLTLFIIGCILMARMHPGLLASLLVITGYQLIIFSLFAKIYAINHLEDEPVLDNFYKYINIEKAIIAGVLMMSVGIGIYLKTKNSILGMTLATIGIQTVSSSFMLSILGIKEK